MMRNPVYNREMKVSSRSIRLPIILVLFNGILSLVTLMNMYSSVAQVESATSIQYTSFMEMYGFVTTIEFILLMFIMPAMTASSISGERERQTLDLMLTTQMTAAQVVLGKLMSALSTLLLLIVSSFPAVTMVFVYGGITWTDAVSLLICYITAAFFAGSLGICFSAMLRRSTISTVATYGVLAAVVAGTYFINKFFLTMSSMNINNSVAAYGIGENALKATSGGVFYLLLLNPAATFFVIISGQTGGSSPVSRLSEYFGMSETGFVMDHWVVIGIAIQLLLSCLMIFIAIRCVEPVKHRRVHKRNIN